MTENNTIGARGPNSKLRSVGAVLAGWVAIFVITTAMDVVLHATGVMPPWGQPMPNALFGLATAYRIVFNIAGCYLTARLAPNRPMRHALVLGVVGAVLSLVATVATWNRGSEFGPHWYPLALVVTALPCAWAGGALYERRHLA